MTEHDIPLTAIVTPAEIIDIKSRFKRPKGIYWEMLPDEKIDDIPVFSCETTQTKPGLKALVLVRQSLAGCFCKLEVILL